MDALIPVFIAVLLAETGDRVQSQAHRLGVTFADHRPIYAALITVTLLTLIISGIGGSYIANLLTYEARTLFAALALLFAGLPMLLRVMNYADLGLDELPAVAAAGARNGAITDDA